MGIASRLAEAPMAEVVRQGRGAMPPFGTRLNEQQILDLIAYLKTLR